MLRKASILWVCVSNLVFAGIVLQHLVLERSLYKLLDTRMPWKGYTIPILVLVILLLGVVLELSNSNLAFFVNGGFFLLAASYAADVLVHASHEPEARSFGWLLGIPAMLVLVIDLVFYSARARVKRGQLVNH